MKIPFIAFAALGLLTGPVPGNPAHVNLGRKQQVIFFDDFSGEKIDRKKWNVIVTGMWVNDECQAYVDSPETLYISHGSEAAGAQNGVLVIQPKYRPGFVTPDKKKFDFISGRIDTRGKFDFS